MTKEEILAGSRRDNKNKDELERAAFFKAGQRACAVGGLVCMVIIILESFLGDQVSFGTWAVYLSMTGTMLLTKYLTLKKKHELIFAVLQLALAAVFLVMYIIRLVR